MSRTLLLALLPLSFVPASRPAPAELAAPRASEFTLADLKALVAQYDAVVPHNPSYTYPIEVTIKEDPAINAAAGIRLVGDKLQTTLEVNTGFLEAVHDDPALIRAVVAHEMAHLAHGHAIQGSQLTDVNQVLTRQEEAEADASGADYLEAIGHERKEMVDLLLFLDSTQQRPYPIWLQTSVSDHASPITRAGLLQRDDKVLAALTRLETGAAFAECRRYEEAILWYEEALKLEPRMSEAHVDIALAALQDYYERLPVKVQEEWLHPAFLPHLTSSTLLGGRAVEVTDKDLARYQRVLDRIAEIPAERYFIATTFLRGTLQVLHPKGDADTIRQGIRDLRSIQVFSADGLPAEIQADQLRLVNNIAVGHQRLGEPERAQQVLIAQSLAAATVFVREAAENIGRLPIGGLDENESVQAINLTATYLQRTPPTAPNYGIVKKTLQAILDAAGRKLVNPLAPSDVYLCQAIAMTIGGEEYSLFDPVEEFTKQLGEPTNAGFLLEKYPDLQCQVYGEEDVLLLTERGSVLKLTTYRPGSSITLKPQNSSARETYTISVGMTEGELDALLAGSSRQAKAITTSLLGRAVFREGAAPESWRYFPALNLGVLVENGKVVGLSVTPVKA